MLTWFKASLAIPHHRVSAVIDHIPRVCELPTCSNTDRELAMVIPRTKTAEYISRQCDPGIYINVYHQAITCM
jgi:hypothetical protein